MKISKLSLTSFVFLIFIVGCQEQPKETNITNVDPLPSWNSGIVKESIINYVEDVRREVYERMITERKRIADRFRSEGQGDASEILGDKERELKRIQSDAYRQAQEIIGKADAEATAIYARAYNRSSDTRDFYRFLKTLESYKNTLSEKDLLILSTKSDFFRYLESESGR